MEELLKRARKITGSPRKVGFLRRKNNEVRNPSNVIECLFQFHLKSEKEETRSQADEAFKFLARNAYGTEFFLHCSDSYVISYLDDTEEYLKEYMEKHSGEDLTKFNSFLKKLRLMRLHTDLDDILDKFIALY